MAVNLSAGALLASTGIGANWHGQRSPDAVYVGQGHFASLSMDGLGDLPVFPSASPSMVE
jgi:hypothetical protein